MSVVRRATPPDGEVERRPRTLDGSKSSDETGSADTPARADVGAVKTRTAQEGLRADNLEAAHIQAAKPRAVRPQADNPEAYIPGDRRRALAAGTEIPDRVHGSAIFADISGFTSLTEALAAELGAQHGAEELTAVLDTVFDAVLGELHRFGGTVVYFSGDAVTCWLDGDDGLLGVACALAMQAAMASVGPITTPGGTTVELGMKVAVSAGHARRFVAGDPDIQLIDVLAGSLMDRLAGAEHDAERGQVVVDPMTARGLVGRVDFAAGPPGAPEDTGAPANGAGPDAAPAPTAGVVTALRVAPPSMIPVRAYPRLPRAIVRQWLLPPVYERMIAGRGEFLAELRPAVPMFVRFGGIDFDDDPDAPEKLDEFVCRVQRVIDARGGYVLQLTVGDKGAYLYAVFGSPVAHEDDAVRACAAALDVLALEDHSAAEGLQIGLASGRLRSGTYGHTQRRTFCCLGDAVNLAARLMSAAPAGQIYVTPAVAKAAARRFDFEELAAMKVKGKAAAIAVRRLLAPSNNRDAGRLRAAHPVVGREAQLDRLVALADDALAGRGHLTGICAEAGMGKSSLAAVLAEIVGDRGARVVVGAADSVGVSTSYLAWQPVWRALLGLSHDGAETPAELVGRLESALAAVDPGLLPRLPLLGAVLGAAIEDNELTASFDAKLRKASLESLLVQLLSAWLTMAPLAIVIEDCHWMDPLSVELLERVARSAAALPLFLLVTYRPGPFAAPALEHTTVIELDRLDTSSCRDVLSARLRDLYGAERVPAPALVERLVARAEGNPFYLGELANYLHDRGADPSDEAAAAIDLPSSLSSLVLSRIDTLGEGARRTLKVASVVGRDFDATMLAGAYPTLGGTRQVLGQLRTLVDQDLVVSEDLTLHRYAFRHAVIQEVAYESLPFALRATVHGRVGRWLEGTDPDALDLLAHHFWFARDDEKKREYLLRAGEAAKARFANDAAVDYFRRLVPLVQAGEREHVLLQLGAVLDVQGMYAQSVEVRRQALALAEPHADAGALGLAHIMIATPLWKQGRYDDAARELDLAERFFGDADDATGLARVANVRGVIALFRGERDVAQVNLQRSLALARQLRYRELAASALGNLGITAMNRGDYETAWALTEEALAVRNDVGDMTKLPVPHNNLGMIAYLQADYERAVPHLHESLRIATEIGSAWTVAMAEQNLGCCARECGDTAGALDHFAGALQGLTVAMDQRALCTLLQNVAMLIATERPETALRLVGAADKLLEAIGATREAFEEAELDAHLRPAIEALGELACREVAAGRDLSLGDAIALCRQVCRVTQ